MYLKRLKLKNYRLFSEVDIIFQQGMNVLIGKNSSGKSTILEAIDFLLSTNNANVPAEEVIPYKMRNNSSVQVRIDGYFEMSDMEKESLCAVLDDPGDQKKIRDSHPELIYTKSIYKKDKMIRVEPSIKTNGNGITEDQNLMSTIFNSFLLKLQTNNVIKITDVENNGSVQKLRPLNELLLESSHQSAVLHQYLRNSLYNMKVGNNEEFNKIRNEIKIAYPDLSDINIDIEFDPQRAQIQFYFIKPGSDIRMPLENEGAGIREFVYLLLTLHNFPDTVILKDEALVHLHKSLLNDYIVAIDGLQYQMITTSHIKELIITLDFANIIICRKSDDASIVKNLGKVDELNKVLDDLGYSVEDIPEIDAFIRAK